MSLLQLKSVMVPLQRICHGYPAGRSTESNGDFSAALLEGILCPYLEKGSKIAKFVYIRLDRKLLPHKEDL